MNYKPILILALILVPTLAFYGLFGSYTPSDDEGYSIGVIRTVAEGVPLYTQQFDFHGPLPFLAKAFLFHRLGIPITQDSIRFWVMAIWLLSCACLSASIWYLTRNRLATACTILVTGGHLFALRFNPGHPEDFVVLFLSLAILIASLEAAWLSDNLRIALLAAIGGVLAATKINVGLFYLFGFVLWMLAFLPRTRLWKAAAIPFGIAATALPLVLMRSFLAESWPLIVITTLGIATTCLAFLRLPVPVRMGLRHAWLSAAVLTATIAAVLAAGELAGSRIADVVSQTVLVAATHSAMIVRPIFTWRSAPAMVILAAVAVIQWRWIFAKPAVRFEPSPAILKVALALTALLFAAVFHLEFYMPFIGAACWLLAFPDGRASIRDRSQSARLFLASIAVFQTLQVFPISGAQTGWSTLALSVCCLVLLFDGLTALALGPVRLFRPATRATQFAGLAMFSLLSIHTISLLASYLDAPGLGFAGANLVRIPMARTADFDWVASSVGHYCDALVTQPGLDSFVLWSSKPGLELMRRSPLLLVDWPITMPEDRQQEAVLKLGQARRVCGVYNQKLSAWWTDRLPQSAQARLRDLPLVAYMQHLSPIREAGDYQIRGNPAVKESWNDDYLLDGVRNLEGSRAAIGVPAKLLGGGSAPDLVFDFEMGGSGPLLSMQASPASSDDEPSATDPLVYVSRQGTVIVRASRGVYVPSRAGVADGEWHELVMRRQGGRWALLLDGQQIGETSDFMASANQPHYLQLGPAYVENCPDLGNGWKLFQGKLRNVKVRHQQAETLNARAAR